jgi:hypothetical protein
MTIRDINDDNRLSMIHVSLAAGDEIGHRDVQVVYRLGKRRNAEHPNVHRALRCAAVGDARETNTSCY